MASLNEVRLIGNTGKDPEIRHTGTGTTVANFTIATTDRWKDKETGEKKEATEWHNVTVWGNLATIVERFVRKGSSLYIAGRLKTRKYEDREGVTRWVTEVVAVDIMLLDKKEQAPPSDGDEPGKTTPST